MRDVVAARAAWEAKLPDDARVLFRELAARMAPPPDPTAYVPPTLPAPNVCTCADCFAGRMAASEKIKRGRDDE